MAEAIRLEFRNNPEQWEWVDKDGDWLRHKKSEMKLRVDMSIFYICNPFCRIDNHSAEMWKAQLGLIDRHIIYWCYKLWYWRTQDLPWWNFPGRYARYRKRQFYAANRILGMDKLK